MPRSKRYIKAGLLHHVILHGGAQRRLFASDSDYSYFYMLLNEAKEMYPAKLFNAVLLPEAIHLLIEPMDDGVLSKFVQVVCRRFALHVNENRKTRGSVFEGRYKSFLVQAVTFYLSCSSYMDMQPVKHQLVGEPSQYPWSGYNVLALGKESALELDRHEVYQDLGETDLERQVAYGGIVKFQMESFRQESFVHDLNLENKRSYVLGNREFRREYQGQC